MTEPAPGTPEATEALLARLAALGDGPAPTPSAELLGLLPDLDEGTPDEPGAPSPGAPPRHPSPSPARGLPGGSSPPASWPASPAA